MYYQPYFKLTLSHDYYPQRRCPNFVVEPTQSCQRMLIGHRCIVKVTDGGLTLLMPMEAEHQPMIPIKDAAVFTFLLNLRVSDFSVFTQLDPQYELGESLYVFSNEGVADSEAAVTLTSTVVQRSRLNLPSTEQSALENRCALIPELRSRRRSNVFGLVEIAHQGALSNADSVVSSAVTSAFTPTDFQILFIAKQQTWTYYLVTDKTMDASAFSIRDLGADNAQSERRFSVVSGEPRDRLLATLQARFPDSQTILLRSESPIPCQQGGRANLQLMKQGHELPWIAHLPNPPTQHGAQVINLLKAL